MHEGIPFPGPSPLRNSPFSKPLLQKQPPLQDHSHRTPQTEEQRLSKLPLPVQPPVRDAAATATVYIPQQQAERQELPGSSITKIADPNP